MYLYDFLFSTKIIILQEKFPFGIFFYYRVYILPIRLYNKKQTYSTLLMFLYLLLYIHNHVSFYSFQNSFISGENFLFSRR